MATYAVGKALYAQGSHEVKEYQEADSQSFKIGEFVYLSSGLATEVATDGTTVLGMALADATNVTSGHIQIPVLLAKPDTVFSMSCVSDGTAAATAAAYIGENYGIYGDTSNSIATCNINETSNISLRCVGLDPRHVVTDTGGRLLVKVITTTSQWDTAG